MLGAQRGGDMVSESPVSPALSLLPPAGPPSQDSLHGGGETEAEWPPAAWAPWMGGLPEGGHLGGARKVRCNLSLWIVLPECPPWALGLQGRLPELPGLPGL